MPLSSGTRLGPYEILEPLGAGGMGEVYTARDTRLDRVVALKTLRSELAGDRDRRTRFEREARAIASLSHPHICTLYDVGHADLSGTPDGVTFLVMELLDGETLAQRLARGPLSLDDALTCAIQIAEALHRAHVQGIVHRDLKPGNIMLTRAGTARQVPGQGVRHKSVHAKLLDFGLAKFREQRDEPVDAATRTSPISSSGMIVGTLQYMAPEQLEGRAVDHRADLFALGAIIYEMVSGRRTFEGESSARLMSAILQAEPPPLTSITPLAPRSLERLVGKCLAKDPEDRWSSAHDARLLLEDISRERSEPSAPGKTARGRGREWVAWAIAAVAIAAAAVFGTRMRGERVAPLPVDVLSIVPSEGTVLTQGEAPQISPDGRTVAFVATDVTGKTQLYIRGLGSADTRALPETGEATLPFWSPDSDAIGFFASGNLKAIQVAGGAPRTLAQAPVPRGGTWNREGVILFVPHPAQPPHRVLGSGGAATPVPTNASAVDARWFPSFLPDGRHYLYQSIGPNRIGQVVRVGSVDDATALDVAPSKANAVYVEPGYLLYREATALVAQRFDVDKLTLTGSPIRIVEKIGFNPITYQLTFSASSRGTLAYVGPTRGWQLVWLNRSGRRIGVAGATGGYNSVCLAADGKRVIHDLADSESGDVDIWGLDLNDNTPSRLTFNDAVDFYIGCAATGADFVFASLRDGAPQLYRGTLAAPGGERRLPSTVGTGLPTDWSADGRFIVYTEFSPTTSSDIWILPLNGGKPWPYVATQADERTGRISPNGRWMTFTSGQNGVFEVYVQPFPATGARWQISRGGGRQSGWSVDGQQLFYISSEKKLVAVDVNTAAVTFTARGAHVIADIRVGGWERTNQGVPFAVTPDGDRFLVVSATDEILPIHIVRNWMSLLKGGANAFEP